MPDDLPSILWYRLRSHLAQVSALPRRKVESRGSSGITNVNDVRPSIPYGADGWRADPNEAWRPLSDLPAAWLPFLNRS